jgi:fatty acid desaturase
VPKIIWLSPIEIQLVNLSGLGLSPEIISPIAGFFEILIGLAILVFRKTLWPVMTAATMLIVLLLYVAIVMPTLLVGAFNPLSTNILGLVLCCIVVISQEQHRAPEQDTEY